MRPAHALGVTYQAYTRPQRLAWMLARVRDSASVTGVAHVLLNESLDRSAAA
jgi:hypothetical protein